MRRVRPMALIIALTVALPILTPFAPAAAQPTVAAPLLTLPIAGTATRHGTFSGTLAISSVVGQSADHVVVEGVVTGTVTKADGSPLGTVLSVPVQLPLTGNWRQVARLAPEPQRRVVLAQSTCGVLHLSIGAIDLDVLGVVVTTTPITLDISGDTAGPLGSLVCSILNLVTTVANLVNLLTSLLGGLGGALGGTA
jgi:hypothetical protein